MLKYKNARYNNINNYKKHVILVIYHDNINKKQDKPVNFDRFFHIKDIINILIFITIFILN